MAPKKAPAAAAGGKDAINGVMSELAGPPEGQVSAFQTLGELAAADDGLASLVEMAEDVMPLTVAALQAAVGSSEEAVLSAATAAAKLVGAMSGASAVACGAVASLQVLPPLVALCALPVEWTAPATELLEAACMAIKHAMQHSVGRLAARKTTACATLLELLSPSVPASAAAVQNEAVLALMYGSESALLRAQLRGSEAQLVALLPAAAADEARQARLLRLFGFCLYDATLRPALLGAGAVGAALTAVAPAAADAAEPKSDELRFSAVTLLAVAAQTAEGRALLLNGAAVATLLGLLGGGGEGGAAAEASTLTANAALAVAHLALLPAAAAVLISQGAAALLLPMVAPAAAGADEDAAAAARANAIKALQHLSAADPSLLEAPAAAAAVCGLLGQSPALPALVATAALETIAQGGRSDAARAVMCEAVEGGEAGGTCLAAVVGELTASLSTEEGEAINEPMLEASLTALTALALHPAASAAMRGAPWPPPDAAAGEAQTGEEAEPPAEGGEGGGGAGAGEGSPFTLVLRVLAEKASPSLCRAAAGCLAAFAAADAQCVVVLVGLGALGLLLGVQEADAGAAAAAGAAISSFCAAHAPAQLWRLGVVPDGVLMGDGFYATGADAKFGDLREQRRDGAMEGVSETLIVDAAADAGLAECVAAAHEELASLGGAANVAPEATATVLARVVAEWQGGAVTYGAYEHYDNAADLTELRVAAGCRAIHVGAVRRGRARQRALLFKALGDAVGLPCGYHMGKCLRGAHAFHAWNTVVAGGDTLVVDVLHTPGELYPEQADAARRYKRIDEFAFSSLAASRHAFNTPASTPAPRTARAA